MAQDIYQVDDQGKTIERIQKLLKKAGYSLNLNSKYSESTKDDVKDFQKKHNLTIDGIVGPNTISKLEEVTGTSLEEKNQYELLKKGDEGAKVKRAQRLLNNHGINLSIDGIYGPETTRSVRKFQEKNDLLVDGLVGENTWNALLEKKPGEGETDAPKIDTESYTLTPANYCKNKTQKRTIVIHHTNGHTIYENGEDNMNHVNYWEKLEDPVGTQYSISYHGHIYQHFDPVYWIYHLGVGNAERDAEAIGIELCNEGPLWKKEDGTFVWRTGQNYHKYLRNDKPIQKTWRERDYWAPYSNAQMESLIWLINYLCKRFNIPKNLVDHIEYDKELLNGNFEGIYTHANVRTEKTDVSPAFDYDRLEEGIEAKIVT